MGVEGKKSRFFFLGRMVGGEREGEREKRRKIDRQREKKRNKQ